MLKPQLDKLLPHSGVVVIDGLDKCMEADYVYRFTQFMESMKGTYGCTKFMEGRSMTSTQMSDLVRTGSDDHPAYTIEPHNEYNVAAKHRPRELGDCGGCLVAYGAQRLMHRCRRESMEPRADALGHVSGDQRTSAAVGGNEIPAGGTSW